MPDSRSGASGAILPDHGWQHVVCPGCGYVTTWPSERLDEEGPPYCIHNGHTVAAPRPRGERWVQTVPALVYPVGASDEHTPRGQNDR